MLLSAVVIFSNKWLVLLPWIGKTWRHEHLRTKTLSESRFIVEFSFQNCYRAKGRHSVPSSVVKSPLRLEDVTSLEIDEGLIRTRNNFTKFVRCYLEYIIIIYI